MNSLFSKQLFPMAVTQKRLLFRSVPLLDIFKVQDDNDYQTKVIEASKKKLVILDFYATWCGPCRQLTPRLETLIASKENQVDLAKVDVDELEGLAAKYQVTSIPAIFAIKDGKVVDKFVGSRDDSQMKNFIDNAL